MKLKLFIILSFFALRVSAQRNSVSSIKIEAKPLDSRKAFSFLVTKNTGEITITYKTVDSIGKIAFDNEDLNTIKRLLRKSEVYFDSLSNDSLVYFQNKLDDIRLKSTYFKIDSTTIYKSSHPSYWKLLETILASSNDELTKQHSPSSEKEGTYCFFTLTKNNEIRQVVIDQINDTTYPLLSKLVNQSLEVIKAAQIVMRRKNK